MSKRNSLKYSGIGSQLSTTPEFGNVQPFEMPYEEPFPMPGRMSYHVPRLGGALKLLVDPQRDLGIYPSAPSSTEDLGADVVTNGDFHDFTMLDDANVKGHWIFDSVYHSQEITGLEINEDTSGNGNDLTAANFSADYVDELTGSNSAYEDGEALVSNGIDQKLSASNPSDFNFGAATDFSLEWVGACDQASKFLCGKWDGSKGWKLETDASKYPLFTISDGGTTVTLVGDTALTTKQMVSVSLDRSGNGILYQNTTSKDTQAISGVGDIDNSADFEVCATGATYAVVDGSEIRISNSVRTAQEIKESYGAGKEWRTGGGAITPTNQSFAQRYTNSANSTDLLSQTATTVVGTLYKITFKGYRVSGSGNLTVELSGAATGTYTYSNTVNARQTIYVLATTTSLQIDVYGSDAGDVYQVEDFVVKPVLNASFSGTTVKDYRLGLLTGDNGTMQNNLEDDQPNSLVEFWFNGVDHFINFGDILDIELNDFIVFGWLDTDASNFVLLDKYYGHGDAAFRFAVGLPTNFRVILNDGSGTFDFEDYTTTNKKALFAAFAINIKTGEVRYFEDGVFSSTKTFNTAAMPNTSPKNVSIGKTLAGLYHDGKVGLVGMYIFDSTSGAPAALPHNYEQIIKYIYEQTKGFYK
jgi:hypothetical protein